MPERRGNDRVSLGPDCTLRFVVKGHAFQGVRIANVSRGGCFLMVPRASAGLFTRGALLEQARFDGEGLPEGTLTGSVSYALAPNPRLAVVGVGVHFVQVSESVEVGLDAFVTAHLGPAD